MLVVRAAAGAGSLDVVVEVDFGSCFLGGGLLHVVVPLAAAGDAEFSFFFCEKRCGDALSSFFAVGDGDDAAAAASFFSSAGFVSAAGFGSAAVADADVEAIRCHPVNYLEWKKENLLCGGVRVRGCNHITRLFVAGARDKLILAQKTASATA